MHRIIPLVTLAVAATLGAQQRGNAGTIVVVPSGNETVEGDSNNSFPLNETQMRYQQVYNASAFGGQSGVIDRILFRVEGGDSSFSGKSLDLEVRLSHTTTTAATLSTTFASNIGGDETLVLDQVLLLSGTGGAGPNPFDVILDIDDVFNYDGVSNLLLEIKHFPSDYTGSQLDSVLFVPGSDLMQRVWSFSVSDTTGAIGGDRGLVTAFDFVAIPEPSTVALALGLFGAVCCRRKRV